MMASIRGHPFLSFCMRQLPNTARMWHHTSKHNIVLTSTGSTFIWAMHMRWAREHDPSEAARLVPAADWGKCSYCQLASSGGSSSTQSASAVAAAARAPPPPAPAIAAAARRKLILSGSRRAEPWRSPFAHGEGSSWHSPDSLLVLLLFCHLDLLFVAFSAMVVYGYARWRLQQSTVNAARLTGAVAAGMLVFTAIQHHHGVILIETFVGRPWIWLIMT